MAENDQRTQSKENPSDTEEVVEETDHSHSDGSSEESSGSQGDESPDQSDNSVDNASGPPEDPGVYVPDYAQEDDSDGDSDAAGSLFLSPDDSESELVEIVSEVVEDNETTQKLVQEFEERLEAIEKERDDFRNRMMRVAADLENFRKRAAREKDELRKFGIDRVVLELLPVIDNLERALAHAVEKDDDGGVVDGVRMVYKQFVSALEKHGVKGFESKGDMFDPQKHEAIQQVETPDHETNTVMDQYQKGYWLHERLIRPALVSVAKRIEVTENEEKDAESVEAVSASDERDEDTMAGAEAESESQGADPEVEDQTEGASESTEALGSAGDEADEAS